MAYYDQNGEKVKIDKTKMEYLNHGNCAIVLHDDKIIFKEYFEETPVFRRLSLDGFKILKDIQDKHFIKLYDIYSKMGKYELYQYKGILSFLTVAYKAEYYPDDSINALYESIHYLLDNFNEIEQLFQVFTANGIATNDVKKDNIICSIDRMILIDPDLFYFNINDDFLQIRNKINLLDLFKDICINCEKKHPDYKSIKYKVNHIMEDKEIDENTNITHELSKRLGSIKRPIEYFER